MVNLCLILEPFFPSKTPREATLDNSISSTYLVEEVQDGCRCAKSSMNPKT
jgi:hypothetical protein